MIEKKTQVAMQAQQERNRMNTELTELKDHMDIKDRKINVLQRKVSPSSLFFFFFSSRSYIPLSSSSRPRSSSRRPSEAASSTSHPPAVRESRLVNATCTPFSQRTRRRRCRYSSVLTRARTTNGRERDARGVASLRFITGRKRVRGGYYARKLLARSKTTWAKLIPLSLSALARSLARSSRGVWPISSERGRNSFSYHAMAVSA